MTGFTVDGELLPARASLVAAVDLAWQRLASAGTWWDARERLALVNEVRRAVDCDLCRRARDALSPAQVCGTHDADNLLPLPAIEAAHRLRTDASRITESWVREITGGELSEEQYVEIVSIVATTTALDTLDTALGRECMALPAAMPGDPTRRRPRGATRDLAFVSTLKPGAVNAGDTDPFTLHGGINIHRAMSLVPQEVINFFDLDVELYLKDQEIRDFAREFREISHAQIELIAGRASALNGCYY